MRFSGHETFPIREGWLHKGLKMLLTEPGRLVSKDAADFLGVGKNMARSIKHWLQATRLAERDPDHPGVLRPTPLGRCIGESDIYFAETATWWFLHINLVSQPVYADTWLWFFNHFSMERFERATVVENLRRYLRAQSRKMPSYTTVDRDVACLLASYARSIPDEHLDPEESRDCPFQELGLMSYFRSSGYYQMHQGLKVIPAHVLGYCLAVAFPECQEGTGRRDIGVSHAARAMGGPGRAFALTPEGVFELALTAEASGERDIEVAGHAGSRVIRVVSRPAIEWVEACYAQLSKGEAQHAA